MTLAVNDWTLARDVGHTTGVAFIDLSKAFDRVVHQELIFTLHSLGIHSSALKWFASYLNSRYQRVCIASGTSSLLPVTRGVPQGTILGPTLYVRLLPDLAAGSGAKLLMFADDKTLYASSRDPIVCADVVSSALTKLHNELRSLGMSVNVDKTVVMRILPKNAPDVQRPVLVELGGTTLREVSVIRCLGILIDNKLSFVPHVDHLTSKVSRKIGALRRTFRQMAAFARRQYLLSVIHPDFEYCFPVYASHLSAQSRERLFTLFRRAVRVTCGASYYDAVPPLLASLQIKHLEYRYIYQFLTFTFICHIVQPASCLRSLFPLPTSKRSTRGTTTNNLSICLYKSMVGYNSFSSRASLMWNALPAHLKGSEDIRSFSTELLHALNDDKLTISLYPLLFENVFHQ